MPVEIRYKDSCDRPARKRRRYYSPSPYLSNTLDGNVNAVNIKEEEEEEEGEGQTNYKVSREAATTSTPATAAAGEENSSDGGDTSPRSGSAAQTADDDDDDDDCNSASSTAASQVDKTTQPSQATLDVMRRVAADIDSTIPLIREAWGDAVGACGKGAVRADFALACSLLEKIARDIGE